MKDILVILAALSLPAAWITHIWICIAAKAWGLLALGAILFPVGIFHGYTSWFGANWF